MKRFFSLILLLLWYSVSAGEVYLFQTTDLHGIVHDVPGKGGSHKVLSALSADADGTGRDRTVVIDCGDLLQGSLESATDRGETMIRLLNAAKYDVWVPGNHDFEFGNAVLRERIRAFRGAVLAANFAFDRVEPFRIFNRNGWKIAVIGMTNEHLSEWLFRPEEEGFHVFAAEDAVGKVLPSVLREKPDAIILAAHAGPYPGKRLKDSGLSAFARRHPEVSVVLGGHTHEKVVCRQLGRTGVSYFQAGAHAGGYLKIRLVFNDVSRKLERVEGEYVPVTESAGTGPEFNVPNLNHPVVCRNFPENPAKKELAGIFAASIAKRFPDAAIVFHGVLSDFRPNSPVLKRLHLFQICPFENKVVLARISAREYSGIVEEQREKRKYNMVQEPFFFPAGKFPFTGKSGERILAAFNSYAASGAGGRFPVLKEILGRPEVQAVRTDCRIFDLLETYAKEKYR